jgi:RNA polymerase sigma-70 factor (sigma-E family)
MTAERRRGIAELYSAHAPGAGRLAFLLTGDRDLAEDLAQEAFVRVIGRFGSLRKPESFDAYLRKTVVNLSRGYFRKRRSERNYLKKEGPRLAAQVSPAPDISNKDEIWRALESLTPRQRAAIVLRYYEDLSERQVADVLDCSVGTVKSLTSRGMDALRKQMGGEAE